MNDFKVTSIVLIVLCGLLLLLYLFLNENVKDLKMLMSKQTSLFRELLHLLTDDEKEKTPAPEDEAKPKIVKLPITDDGLKDYIPPSKPQKEYYNIAIDEAELKPSDEKTPEWYYLRLDEEIIDKTKLFQKYDDKWYVDGDVLTYTTKKGAKCSRKVYGKAEKIQSLCDLFFLINQKTKAIEALTCSVAHLAFLKNKVNDDVVLYGGILVADDYYVNFVCEYNPNSDLFYSIER